MFEIKMSDGSMLKISNELWLKALDIKLKGKTYKRFEKLLVKETERHWKDKTIPTRFGVESWKDNLRRSIEIKKMLKKQGKTKSFENMAELAEKIMYNHLRSYFLRVV